MLVEECHHISSPVRHALDTEEKMAWGNVHRRLRGREGWIDGEHCGASARASRLTHTLDRGSGGVVFSCHAENRNADPPSGIGECRLQLSTARPRQGAAGLIDHREEMV